MFLRGRARRREVTVALADGCCYVCGGNVEDALARLGSTRCHDCRTASVNGPLRAEA